MYEVIVLFDGYSRSSEAKKDSGFRHPGFVANCSCTLLKGSENLENIIVDTLTSWDGQKLQEELKKHDVKCEDIDYVVCTHGHSDHVGCNYLFPKAKLIVGFCISFKDFYVDHDFRGGEIYVINEYVKVMPTPGHTLEDVSVIVESKNKGTVAVVGDLFEDEQDLRDDSLWKLAGSGNDELQLLNRNKILKLADWIVPGHGPIFKVPDTYKVVT